MDLIFGKKKDGQKASMRKNKRSLQKGGREMDRELRKLKVEEAKCQREVKALLKRGDKVSARILAKQIVQIRKQQQRLLKTKGQLKGMEFQQSQMKATQAMGGAMKTGARVMKQMNAQVNTQQMQHIMKSFAKENMKYQMTGEMMDDVLDDAFETEGMDEETDAAIGSILDEIGIETGDKLSGLKTGGKLKTKERAKVTDDDVDDLLAQLDIPT